MERLEELLAEGNEIQVTYMYSTTTDGEEIPTGVMYVLKVTAPRN